MIKKLLIGEIQGGNWIKEKSEDKAEEKKEMKLHVILM
jgi:hypothetical protein